ncbi:MAG: putative hydroxymethylpyrimidine transporter CytX [Clostridiaceae bacterium]
MEIKKTSVKENSLIWFGAAVSLAEILTGTFIAPLGFKQGITAVLLGHLIGCVLLYLAGMIGGKTGKSAMDTVKISFGEKGSYLFSVLNIAQLVGWTAIMIYSGALAAVSVAGNMTLWSIAIGILIIVWILVGVTNLGKLNTVTMSLLFLMTIVLSFIISRGTAAATGTAGTMTFSGAMELSVAMPLSWLPLISDYTRYAKNPKKATFFSSLTYFVTSSWMYIIGMGAAILTGETDIGKIMLTAGLGLVGVFIIIGSTVTTTFMDAYSAGVSSVSIFKNISEKWVGVAVTVIGVALTIFTDVLNLEGFLYLIGSVFAPMIAILIMDFFILRKDSSNMKVNWINLIIWGLGFITYRLMMGVETPLGSTVPAMAVTMAISFIINKLVGVKTNEVSMGEK